MSYAANRDAMAARINSVADAGVVSNYRRSLTTWADFQTAFTCTIGGVMQVRGWSIAWESGDMTPETWMADGSRRMQGYQTWVARGYLGVKDSDATDRTFSALVEDVRTALVTMAAALTAPSIRQSHVPVMVRQNGFIELGAPGQGQALCHYAEISVTFLDSELV